MIKARLFAILEINLFILNKQIIHNIHQEIIAAAGIKVAFDSELRNKIKSSLSSLILSRKKLYKNRPKYNIFKARLKKTFYSFRIKTETDATMRDLNLLAI